MVLNKKFGPAQNSLRPEEGLGIKVLIYLVPLQVFWVRPQIGIAFSAGTKNEFFQQKSFYKTTKGWEKVRESQRKR